MTRERLEDGTVRLTVVSNRRSIIQTSLIILLVLAAAIAILYFIAPPRFHPRLWLLGGLGIGGWLLMLLILMTQPREYTSVFEAGPFGIRLQTMVAGDPVRRTFAREEILAIEAVDGNLIIVARGEQHPLPAAGAKGNDPRSRRRAAGGDRLGERGRLRRGRKCGYNLRHLYPAQRRRQVRR